MRDKRTEEGAEHIKMLIDSDAFNTLMRQAGVNNGDAIVIASLGENSDDVTFATRLYWMLKYYQHDNMALLNGGVSHWVKDGKTVANAPAEAKPGNFTASGENTALLSTTAQVKTAVENDSAQLIDARTLDFYLGAAMKSYVFGKGHIPASKHFPHTALVHWKAPAVFIETKLLGASLEAMGVDLDKPVIAYCNSAHLASGTWFLVSELLGKANASLYDGSMHAWTKDKSLPLVTMKME
jgi:thiosulfate/3-mercaptopyruvate sulfurtransferase